MRASSLAAVALILGAAAQLAAAASLPLVELPLPPLATPPAAAAPQAASAASLPTATRAGTAAALVAAPAASAPPWDLCRAMEDPAARVPYAVAASAAGRGAPAPHPASAGAQARAMAAAVPGSAGAAFDNAAPPAPDAKELEKVDPLEFEPMQIPVGMREVERKEKNLRALDEKGRRDWLQSRAVPYVKRGGKRRPIDRHHETRAAWQAGMAHVYAYSAVSKKEQQRLDAMGDAEFWAEMSRRGWFYDKDQFGEGPRSPDQLPEDTRGHADDPFRSVAGEVRRRGGFDKSSTPFVEFAWANFFRARVKTYPRGAAGFEKAVAEALALAKSPEAAGLPGYNGAK